METDPRKLRAHWIDRETVLLPPADVISNLTYYLSFSRQTDAADAVFRLSRFGDLDPAQAERFPQLRGYAVFRLPAGIKPDEVMAGLKGKLTVSGLAGARVEYVSGVQIAGVLDDLFYFSGTLGPKFPIASRSIDLALWAPTARWVHLLLFHSPEDAGPAEIMPMLETGGVWSVRIDDRWRGRYYLFRVNVFVPDLQEMVENLATDPYSVDLALNGSKSRLTDLTDGATKPVGWDTHRAPALKSKNDLSIMEMHVREFSSNDASVPSAERGTYLAFGRVDSNGMKHLKGLASAGLKAVHLMPTFHIASLNEDKAVWKTTGDLSGFPPDGTQQQAAVAEIKDQDAWNWGYDPVHYMAPEGAYAVDPYQRVREYRAMVQSLHGIGLRVIQDLVFNHTDAQGQDANSVLDKIVPAYYYRLDGNGKVFNSSCCPNTAAEHKMMEKLMIDAIVLQARYYKVDGFRFDLMGLHFVYNLQHIQQALSQLTWDEDGVDGSKIHIYGEGWNLGEVANNAFGPNATQVNLFGTGIGTFNDRIRDAIRGGNPFGDLRLQGFATGLFTSPNSTTRQIQSRADQENELLTRSDWLRAALAGNLRDFRFLSSRDHSVVAGQLDYNGTGVGYTASPIEVINYCSVHDNLALWDSIQLKSVESETVTIRVRRQILALSLLALAQGIPFFYGGDEILRSKDMDNNSYNSGDWFNKLDYTYQTNNWGSGLPLASENDRNWSILKPLLADPDLKVIPDHIAAARDAFERLLKIRYSSDLFRMQTLGEIQQNLSFLNTEPGVIAMRLDAKGGKYSGYQQILAIFNAKTDAASTKADSLKGLHLTLHPALQDACTFDGATGTAYVTALTAAVFVA